MATYEQVILTMARVGVSLARQSDRTLEDVIEDLMIAMASREVIEAEEYARELEIAQDLEARVFEQGVD